MSNMPAESNGLRKQLNDLKSKLEDVKSQQQTLTKEVEKYFNDLFQKVNLINEVLGAVTEFCDEGEIKAIIKKKRKVERDAHEAQQSASRKLLVEQRILVPADVVGENVTLVTKDTNPEGDVMVQQFPFANISNPEFKALFLGKAVGDSISIQGTNVEITELYTFDKARAEAVVAEETAKQQAAQQAAALAQSAQAALEPVASIPEVVPEQPAVSV